MMDPYMAQMMMEQLSPEEQKLLAAQMRNRASDGGALSTSTIAPVAAQGRLMQTEAQTQAQGVGLQNYRKKALQQREDEALLRASSVKKDSPFNNITSAERRAAAAEMNTNNSEAMLQESWKPDFQMQGYGGIAEGAARYGVPMTEGMEDSVTYWKNYAEWENSVRKELFGSALTGYELKAWDKANVNSKMDPDLVQKNMNIRNIIMQKKAAEQAATKLDYGWPQETIARMYKVLPAEAWEDLDAFADQQEEAYKAFYEGGPATTEEGSANDLSRMSLEELRAEKERRGL